jgi:hypothetical protein
VNQRRQLPVDSNPKDENLQCRWDFVHAKEFGSFSLSLGFEVEK